MSRHPASTDSKVHNAVYRSWKNKDLIKDVEPETIYKKRNQIVKYIERPDGFKDGTKKAHYLSLANAMKLNNNFKLSDKYVENAVALNNIQETKYKTNQASNKQMSASTWEEIRTKYEELSKDKKPTRIVTQQKLLCGLNVYQPPIRAEPEKMKFLPDVARPTENALVKRKDSWFYFLTNYKTKGTYGDKYIKISKKACDIIDESLKELPREYLYINHLYKPIGRNGYASLIKQTLGKSDSVNTLRSSYASHALSEGNMSQAEKEVLSDSMATSVERLETVYRKIESDDEADIDQVTGKVSEYKPKPRGRPKGGEVIDRKKYAKEYYEKNKEDRQNKNADYFKDNRYEIYKRQVIKRIKAGCNVSKITREKYGLENYGKSK
jgi:hypothetical protein